MSFKKNTAVTGFSVGMVNKTTGADITTGTVNGFVTIDGGVQTALTNILVHQGNGLWSVNLTAGEMNGDVIGLTFTHTDAVTQHFTIKTLTELPSDLNDLDAAGIRAAVGLASANLDTQLDALPTVSEFNARTLVSADYATASALSAVAGDVSGILDDTGTSGVVIAASTANKIADHTLRRQMSNVEASSDGDALSLGSAYGLVQQAQESAVSAGTLTVKKTDGTTTLGTKTVTSNASADPITGVS